MVFSSFEFIVLFLPAVFAGKLLVARLGHQAVLAWLVLASLFFYGWWNIAYVPLIVGLTAFNFACGQLIIKYRTCKENISTILTVAGIGINLLTLAYFKYADFLIRNVNSVAEWAMPLPQIILPLGISFFIFQKIAYLADCRAGKVQETDALKFSLFVMFFPQLIAGPIVHHAEVISQFSEQKLGRVNWDNVAAGIFIFTIGLFKKIVIADNLAPYATWGFDVAPALTMSEAWLSVLSYTFQLYFDFSGYSDMAIGAALLFNIRLPYNFDSPYKAGSIREFWRRWHMTLGRFLRDYLYIPLGGNKHGTGTRIFAAAVTFLLGGLWHGASWMFVLWGLMHGAGIAVNLLWAKTRLQLPRTLSWLLTFSFITMAWVLFRAKDWASAAKVYSGLVNFSEIGIYPDTPIAEAGMLPVAIVFLLLLCVGLPNSNRLLQKFRPDLVWLLASVFLALISFLSMGDYSEFLYFQF